ncbi:hypothetical protein BLNAU_4644 [Blattamonas nauphoetae]|uniref:Uncharacterized protein n=1 Tax=Blattamonas nauphoetae TaxID=2049346 RepID=A0ABQ9Y9M2_9EUKA|nr:hypothetical protein BLNAU_4644 [Blattamonas nauphoetae]
MTIADLHQYISLDPKHIHPRSPHVVLLDGAVVRESQIRLPFLEGLSPQSRPRHLHAFLEGRQSGQVGNQTDLTTKESNDLKDQLLELISCGVNPTYQDIASILSLLGSIKNIMHTISPPDSILQRKIDIQQPQARARLLFDGHSSRNQPELWMTLGQMGIDCYSLVISQSMLVFRAICKNYLQFLQKQNKQLMSREFKIGHEQLSRRWDSSIRSQLPKNAWTSTYQIRTRLKVILHDDDDVEGENITVSKIKRRHSRKCEESTPRIDQDETNQDSLAKMAVTSQPGIQLDELMTDRKTRNGRPLKRPAWIVEYL